MLAVGRLVRIVKTIGDKVISKSRFYNTFNYLRMLWRVTDRQTDRHVAITITCASIASRG